MAHGTGFSDVESSDRAPELVAYLRRLAEQLAEVRRRDFERLRLQPGAAVLDAGCGAGEVCVELAAQVGPQGRVFGIDPSSSMIAAAQQAAAEAHQAVDFRVASIYDLPFAGASFDAVRAERVFQHLDDPVRGLREMTRVTRPGGRVMVIDTDHSQARMPLGDADQRRLFEAARAALLRSIVNARVGTALRSLFADNGLIELDLVVHPLQVALADYLPVWFLREALAAAAEAGEIESRQAQDFLTGLERPGAADQFRADLVGYSMVGTRP